MNRILLHMSLCFSLFSLAACSSPTREGAMAGSLGGNRRLPSSAIAGFYQGRSWEILRDKPYAGYVILQGAIGDDRRVHNLKIVEAYPDEARSELASTFAERVPITGVSVGSNMRPLAEVCVLFYEKDEIRRHALVYAEQTGIVGNVRSEGAEPPKSMLLTMYY